MRNWKKGQLHKIWYRNLTFYQGNTEVEQFLCKDELIKEQLFEEEGVLGHMW